MLNLLPLLLVLLLLLLLITQAQSIRRESLEARAERDLWTLLEIFTRSHLIKDLDDESKTVIEVY